MCGDCHRRLSQYRSRDCGGSRQRRRIRSGSCQRRPSRAVAIGDLTDPAVPARLVEEALAAFGRLDFVVANAGTRPEAPLGEMSYEAWRHVMALTLDSVFLLIKAALPALRRSERASIVMLGGLSAHSGGSHRAHHRIRRRGDYGQLHRARPDRYTAR